VHRRPHRRTSSVRRATGVTYTVYSRAGWTDGTNPLAGSYTFGFAYDMADHRTQVIHPAAGGLSAETVTTGYNSTGQAVTLGGDAAYVEESYHDYHGRLWWRRSSGGAANATVTRHRYWDYATGAIWRLLAYEQSNGTVQDVRFTRDTASNVSSVTDHAVGQRQCFGYDTRDRLTSVYTTTSLSTCGGFVSGGPAPFSGSYSYDSVGRFVTGPAGNAYTYAAGRPHAVASVTTPGGVDTFTYDAAGNRKTWVDADGPNRSYSWDVDGRLTAETTGSSTTSYLSDHDRQRVLRKDPDGTVTLYLGEHVEIRRTPAGVREATRWYRIGDELIALRAPGALEWVLTDLHGSVHTSVDAATGAERRVQYTPYGDVRHETSPGPRTERRYLGAPDDPTGLIYLNNRYHDPTTGQFISVDPMVTVTDEPYIYGSSNPITYSDPDGLMPCAVRSCPDGIPVVHYDRPDMRSWLWPALKFNEPDPSPTATNKFPTSHAAAKQLHDTWNLQPGPAGRLTSSGLPGTCPECAPDPFDVSGWGSALGKPLRHLSLAFGGCVVVCAEFALGADGLHGNLGGAFGLAATGPSVVWSQSATESKDWPWTADVSNPDNHKVLCGAFFVGGCLTHSEADGTSVSVTRGFGYSSGWGVGRKSVDLPWFW
jgi:RHS repeat-associated protein